MGQIVTKNKILVLGGGVYARPFMDHGTCVLVSPTSLPDEYDWNTVKLVVFTGGADVDPSMYNEKIHPTTYSDIHRDKMEAEYFSNAFTHKVPMVGICRGSQFLTVMNGGSVIQNVYSHADALGHTIISSSGNEYLVTSTHHQMMYPKGEHEVLAWANGLSKQYETGITTAYPRKKEPQKEPEVVWFKETDSLAVQFHPEYMDEVSTGYQYFQELLEEYVL